MHPAATAPGDRGHQNMVYEPEPDDAILASDPRRRYPGARISTAGMKSDPGFIRPAYSSPAEFTPSNHFYYPK